MEDNFRDTVLFNGIGTDKVVIGHSAKMGSTSLDHFQQDNSEFIKYLKNEPYDENKIYVLIRDIMNLWKSGYIYELKVFLEDIFYNSINIKLLKFVK